MKYMIMMFGDQSGMATQTPEWIKEMFQFMHQFNAEIMKSGEFVDAQVARGGYETVSDWPLCLRPSSSKNGTAFLAHCSADG